MPPAPPAAVFEPHVSAAIVCLAVALVAALLAFVLGLADDEERRK
jgi:hypothetical protein